MHAPFTQRLAEVRSVPVQSHPTRRIEQSADAQRGVDQQARGIADTVIDIALQELIDDGGWVGEVAQEIVDRRCGSAAVSPSRSSRATGRSRA